MSQFNQGTQTIKGKPGNNIYSLLVFVAFIALAIAVGVMWWKNIELTGDLQPASQAVKNPFYIVDG
jgi:hypothetical protein